MAWVPSRQVAWEARRGLPRQVWERRVSAPEQPAFRSGWRPRPRREEAPPSPRAFARQPFDFGAKITTHITCPYGVSNALNWGSGADALVRARPAGRALLRECQTRRAILIALDEQLGRQVEKSGQLLGLGLADRPFGG